MVDLIQKYNQKLQRRMNETKQTNSEIFEQLYKVEENFTNNTYQVGLGADPQIHKQFVLSVMSHFHQQNKELKELVTLKNHLNNNSVKMALYREIVEGIAPAVGVTNTSTASAGSSKNSPSLVKDSRLSIQTATFGEAPEQQDADNESEQEELRVLTEETARLITDISNLGTRTQMLDKELKKTKDFTRIKKDDNLDKKIADLEQQIKDIQEDIQLLCG